MSLKAARAQGSLCGMVREDRYSQVADLYSLLGPSSPQNIQTVCMIVQSGDYGMWAFPGFGLFIQLKSLFEQSGNSRRHGRAG